MRAAGNRRGPGAASLVQQQPVTTNRAQRCAMEKELQAPGYFHPLRGTPREQLARLRPSRCNQLRRELQIRSVLQYDWIQSRHQPIVRSRASARFLRLPEGFERLRENGLADTATPKHGPSVKVQSRATIQRIRA